MSAGYKSAAKYLVKLINGKSNVKSMGNRIGQSSKSTGGR